MALSNEDMLRLNVLLANKPRAIRIHENSMTVYGLAEQGEAKVELHPTSKDETYLKEVRELLSGHVLGSPGGYPVYLKRWTRMGQIRDDNLEQLLLLGEPEAVVAVVHASGLTDEIARRAWWCDPQSEAARQMLKREAVVTGSMGKVLAEHLVEHLAFEDDPLTMLETVRLILQPGLVDAATKESIWRKARRKNSYLLGFLIATPDDYPEMKPARADRSEYLTAVNQLAEQGNAYAQGWLRITDTGGQTWLDTVKTVLEKPFNQDVVNVLMETVALYFQEQRPPCHPDQEMEELLADADALCQGEGRGEALCSSHLRAFLAACPQLHGDVRAMLILSRLGYPVVRPVFSRTTAIGTLMRKKLKPVTDPIFDQLQVLRTA